MKTGIGRLGLVAVWAGWVAAGWTLAPAQSTVDFDARSIAFRTALHQDASLEAPFDQLVDLYRRADRLPELRRIYEAHLAQYPADQGARAVHLRLLLIEDDPEASAVAREAVRLHPADPLLHALLHQATGELEPLSQAIALETRPDRRRLWLQQLLTLATGESERALAAAQLREERDRRLATDPDGMPELIDWTERAGFVDLARESLAAAEQAQPSAEAVIDLTLTGARLDGLDSRTRAADRLTGLLGRLAPEHPRRRELVLLRREFGGAPPVADAGSPAGAVDLAAWLEADGKRREAGETLLEAALRFPHLAWLEERARGLIADEPDVWRGYLDRRATLLPARQGIDQERVALAFALEGVDAGRTLLAANSGKIDLLTLGTDLLGKNLPAAAGVVFRMAGSGFAPQAGLIRALIAQEDGPGVTAAVGKLSLDGADPEAWIRLAEVLEQNQFDSEARELLRRGLAAQPSQAATLLLAKLSAPEERAKLLESARTLTAEEDDYRDWLIAAAEFAAAQGDSEALWNREAARLTAKDHPVDADLIRRVATFASVAEERSQIERARRVIADVLERAAPALQETLPVRRLALIAWETDPSRAPEVERNLLAMLEADPGSGDDRLRLALLYERVRRPDLAKPQWASLDWSKVQMTALLEQAAGVAPDLEVWTRLTELRPGDVKAWEKRLNALREAGREKEFRDALQVLLPPAGPVEISEVVREALRTQWFASWGRELEIGLQEGRNLENVLRKVRELLQEDLSPSQRNWVRWFGAAILQRAGRDAESEAWRAQVKDDPTGEVAPAALRALCGEPWPSAESRRLGPMDRLRWKYEPPAVSRVAGLVACGDAVLVLDDRGAVAALDGSTGLLRWRREVAVSFPEPSPSATKTLPLFGDVFAMPDFISDGTRAFLGGRDGVIAIDGATGNLLWEARPGGERPVRNGAMAPVPGRIGLATGDLVVALFPDQGVLMAVDAITGKLRWRREIGSGLSGAAALSTGFAVAGPAVAISGPDGVELYRASTGERVWRHRIAPDGPIRLNGPAEAAPSGGVRHLGFVGKHLFAMEDGVVHELPVDFPAAGRVRAIEGIWLGDGCFETEECVSAGNGTVIRGGKGRLTAWQAATGRKLWETENPAISWTAPVAVTTCWRGTITEERRQGFVLRRCWRPSAVFVAGGVAIAGEQEVIAIGGKETR